MGLLPQMPFEVGATSFVLPDQILPNVEWLLGRVDDVQLLMMEAHGDLPDERELRRLRRLAEDGGMSYTVHLPVEPMIGDPDEPLRRWSVAVLADLITDLEPVVPTGWVLHPEPKPPPAGEERDAWVERCVHSIGELLELTGIEPHSLRLENMEQDLEPHREVMKRTGVSGCLDLGHVLLLGGDPVAFLEAHLPVATQLHIHGVTDRDHVSLEHYPRLEATVQTLLDARFEGILTLEVFSEPAFRRSMDELSRAAEAVVARLERTVP